LLPVRLGIERVNDEYHAALRVRASPSRLGAHSPTHALHALNIAQRALVTATDSDRHTRCVAARD
jgi:hypothetical protein